MPVKSDWNIDIPNIDVWSMYFEEEKPYPAHQTLFVDCNTNRSYTYTDVKKHALEFGKGLKYQFKWQKGDVLGFFAPNSIDTPPVTYGLLWAGGIASPANPAYTVDELARQLRDSGAKALVTQLPFLQAACAAADKVGMSRDRVILMGDGRDRKHKHWTDISAKDAWIQPKRTSVDPGKDLAYLVYSSGTTGLPKGVMLTHSNIVANSKQFERLDPRVLDWQTDKHLGVLPFFHIYGLSVSLNVSMATGATCIIMPKFDLEQACSLIQKHAITFLYVPPPIVLGLGKHPVVDKYDLSSIRYINSGAAPLGKDLVEAVWERLKIGVKQGYGLSETSPAATTQLTDEWARFQGSVGRLVPNMEAMIVAEDGKEMPAGEAGEIWFRGPNVFQGYWKKPELDKETFSSDGWYKTGDVGYFNDKGHLFITDRIKELIKYKGFQVPPAELEAKLLGRKDISDVCVVGVWDNQQHTEVPRAYVVVAQGVTESDELAKDIIEWMASKVAPPKKLRGGVRFRKEIPKSAAGKTLRRVLKEEIKQEQRAEGAKL